MAQVIVARRGPLVVFQRGPSGAAKILAGNDTANAARFAGNSASSATLSQAWAEGTEPGGPGTKSAKGWAEDAKSQADRVHLLPERTTPVGGNGDALFGLRDLVTGHILPIVTIDFKLWGRGLVAGDIVSSLPDARTTGNRSYPIFEMKNGRTGPTMFAINSRGESWIGALTGDTASRIGRQIAENVVTWRRGAGEISTDRERSSTLQRATVTDPLGWTGRVVQKVEIPGIGYDTSLAADAPVMTGLHDFGQSTSGNSGADLSVLTAQSIPHHAFIFSSGIAGTGPTLINPATLTDFVPARDPTGSGGFYCIATSFAAAWLDRRRGSTENVYLARSDWDGGKPLVHFFPDGNNYQNLLGSISRGKIVAKGFGKNYKPVVFICQGESGYDDFGSGTPSTNWQDWYDGIDLIINQLRADVFSGASSYGGTPYTYSYPANYITPAIMFFQTNAGDASTAAYSKPWRYAQYKAGLRYLGTDAGCIGPMYQYPLQTSDLIHPTTAGKLMIGELKALVNRIIARDGKFNPLIPRSVSRDGAVITIDYHLPSDGNPITFDSDWITAAVTNYGFTYSDDSGSPPAISSVAITGPAQVQVTLASAPTGGSKVIRYAIDAEDTVTDGWASCRGLLYSSSGERSAFAEMNDALSLGVTVWPDIRHYAIAFEETVA